MQQFNGCVILLTILENTIVYSFAEKYFLVQFRSMKYIAAHANFMCCVNSCPPVSQNIGSSWQSRLHSSYSSSYVTLSLTSHDLHRDSVSFSDTVIKYNPSGSEVL